MFATTSRIVCGLILVALVAAGSATASTIVTNGDFESGTLNLAPPSWTLVTDVGSGGPYGFQTASTGGIWDNGTTSVLGTGGRVMYVEVFNAQAEVESLEQTVTLVGGTPYQVTYEENARQIARAGLQPLVEVFLGGTSVVAQHSVSPVNAQNVFTNPFHAITSSTFTPATSGSYVLEFKVSQPAAGLGTSDLSALFDNIAITAPEPASFTLLAGGAVMMMARRRRGRSGINAR